MQIGVEVQSSKDLQSWSAGTDRQTDRYLIVCRYVAALHVVLLAANKWDLLVSVVAHTMCCRKQN